MPTLLRLAALRLAGPVLALLASALPSLAQADRPPNVLFLLADDQQPDAIAALGNADVITPNLDRLVEEGFAFTNAYCLGSTSGAVCAPSRAMLFSGRTLWRLGANVFALDTDWPLLPEVLGAAGFETFATGKQHNGRAWFARSFERGAEIFFGGMGDHEGIGVHDFDPTGAYPGNARHRIAAFSSTAFADATIRFLEERDRERPFFAYVSFTAPHDPRTPPADVRALYEPAELELPVAFMPEHPFDNGELDIRDERLAPTPRTPAVVREHLADYYGMITHLDREVGRILEALERTGERERTLVVYTADHGLAVGRHGLLGKQNLYEHSMGAPLVLAGPGIPRGARSDALVALPDLFPTLCELVGTAVPASVEGRSLAPILRGEAESVRDAVLLAYRHVQRAIRTPRWKLILYPEVGEKQLFDLSEDPDELVDLSAEPEQAARVAELTAELRALQREAGDPLAPRQPNVVLFLVDDLGWQDLSVPLHSERTPFNDRYRTPHLARLASEGLSFTDAYSASPVCTPTRTAILTGQSPARTRITNWTLSGDRSADHPTLTPPAWNLNGLSSDPETPRAVSVRTLPALLADAGYRTIHVGKAHFGALDTPGADPENLGFERNVAGHAAGGPGSHWGERNYSAAWRGGGSVWDVPDLDAYHGTDTYLTEALTIEACRLVDEAVADGVPFFLHLAHYAVHAPIEADARWVEPYREQGLDEREAAYASMVEGYDASLGAVLAKLTEHGIADETVVIFTSDNGGLSAHGRGGEPHVHNAPLASGKGSAYEGGVRVPLVVRWPGAVAPGGRTAEPVTAVDLFPTILALAGVDVAAAVRHPLDGLGLGPLLGDPAGVQHERALTWHYPHQWGAPGPGIHPYSAIRRGPWKLVWFYAEGRAELYRLDRDLGETTDLAAAEPERARALTEDLAAWLEAAGAQTPVSLETRDPLPLPGRD